MSFIEEKGVVIVERDEILVTIKNAIIDHFGHWETSSIGYDGVEAYCEEYIDKSHNMRSKRQFLLLLFEYLNNFNNRHTLCFDPEIEPVRFNSISDVGFEVEFIENEWIIAESSIDDLSSGNSIESIDDVPVDTFITNCIKYFCELEEKERTMRMNLLLPYILSKNNASIKYRDKTDRVHELAIARKQCPIKNVYVKALPGNDAAYICIPSFLLPEYETSAIRYIESFSECRSIIIDVRKNRGGTTPRRLISALMNVPWQWWGEKNTTDKEYRISPMNSPVNPSYDGKLIILVDRNTFSAAEDFVMPFKDNGRATIIGEKTFGSTGQPHFFNINSLNVAIGSKRVSFPDGKEFEGIGITPNILAENKIDDFCSNKLFPDEVLEHLG